MDYRVVCGLIIVFLLVEMAIMRGKLNKVYGYMKTVNELSEQIVAQHERYKEQADAVREYFTVVQKSNNEVDLHYSQMKNQMEVIKKALLAMMSDNKQKQEGN